MSLEVRIFGSPKSNATETNGGYGPFDYAPSALRSDDTKMIATSDLP